MPEKIVNPETISHVPVLQMFSRLFGVCFSDVSID